MNSTGERPDALVLVYKVLRLSLHTDATLNVHLIVRESMLTSNLPLARPRLVIIGTIHVDLHSVEVARRTVEEVHPEVVAVELCPTRYEHLMMRRNVKKSRWRIGSIGWWASQLEKRVGEILGVYPGSEMISAIEAARKIGSRIALIDQPIALTLRRIAKAPLREKLELYLALVGAGIYFSIPRKSIEYPEDTSLILSEFEKQFPHTFKVLVTERNEYMASMLNSILRSTHGRVVAVVGKGHQEGLLHLMKNWISQS